MKKILYFVTVAAALVACMAGCSKRPSVTEPQWYTNPSYFQEKNGMYEEMPLSPGNIVMVGDDYIDRGLWNEFFGDTAIKNRGITYDATEHVLSRIEGIASCKPLKLFLSVGLNDVLHGTSNETVVANVTEIFRKVAEISPMTKLYYMDIVSIPAFNEKQAEAASAINDAVRSQAARYNFEFIDVNAELEEGLADGTFSWDGGKLLNGAGYEVLARTIERQVGKMHLNHPDDIEYPLEVSDYYKHRVSVFRSLPETEEKIVMLGNSLINNGLWSELFPMGYIINRGISGDVIDGVCQRLDEIKGDNPDKIFLITGTNDLVNNPDETALAVFGRYENLIATITREFPDTQLYVQSILPLNPKSKYHDSFNARAAEINKLLSAAAGRYGYFYLDIASLLSDEKGDLNDDYTTDGIHLSADGYFVWAAELAKGNRMMLQFKVK